MKPEVLFPKSVDSAGLFIRFSDKTVTNASHVAMVSGDSPPECLIHLSSGNTVLAKENSNSIGRLFSFLEAVNLEDLRCP